MVTFRNRFFSDSNQKTKYRIYSSLLVGNSRTLFATFKDLIAVYLNDTKTPVKCVDAVRYENAIASFESFRVHSE